MVKAVKGVAEAVVEVVILGQQPPPHIPLTLMAIQHLQKVHHTILTLADQMVLMVLLENREMRIQELAKMALEDLMNIS